MTYLLVNLPFLGAVAAAVVAVALRRRGGRVIAGAFLVTLAALLLLTAVFDNVIIGLGIVAYDSSTTSGITIGVAPIEDFAYAVAAALGLPALWLLLPPTKRRPTGERA
ncbi:lycopene cyclase domain-containing protein [Herbiconiux sp. L3-i23]|uniref:lycopene cyclase domain-containing protein n=1 Tax=Herbiconiux sp. L3-i23 TaxID=2905871 RepID=UPI0020625811|nr:lycopene cyclase domain-containing protein [Herbiconiux sp. L3-i23]BDI24151.1 hypothetical protein L3i23_29270 [Herbiconiux sp. L3-i23]